MLCIPPNAFNQDRELNVFAEEIPRMVVFTRSHTRSQTRSQIRSETRCTVVAGDDKQCTLPYEKEFYEYSETSLRICSEHLKHMDELRQDRKSLETVTLNNTGPLTDDKIAIIKAYLIQRAASSSSSPDNPSTPANSDIPPKDSGKKRRAEEDPPRNTQTVEKELNVAREKIKLLESHVFHIRKHLSVYNRAVRGSMKMDRDKAEALKGDIRDLTADYDKSIDIAKNEIHGLKSTILKLKEELEKSKSFTPTLPVMRSTTPDEDQAFSDKILQDFQNEELTETLFENALDEMFERIYI